MKCKNCGSELKEGSLFCAVCGAKQDETPSHNYDSYGTNSAIFMVYPANSLFGIMFFFVANATEFRKAVEEEVYKHLK